MIPSKDQEDFSANGVAMKHSMIPLEVVSKINTACVGASGCPKQSGFNISQEVWELISAHGRMGQVAKSLFTRTLHPVRVSFFDKTSKVNWAAPWHQDRTIAVQERANLPGYSGWNYRGGIVYVEPPTSLLQNMLTLRLLLDDCDHESGPIEVACSTHNMGRVPASAVAGVARGSRSFVATGRAGDVLATHPLLLHKSNRAIKPSRRRILRVDYASEGLLPPPLKWAVM